MLELVVSVEPLFEEEELKPNEPPKYNCALENIETNAKPQIKNTFFILLKIK